MQYKPIPAAVKRFRYDEEDPACASILEAFRREVEVLQKVEHRNVIGAGTPWKQNSLASSECYDVIEASDYRYNSIVLECMSSSDLAGIVGEGLLWFADNATACAEHGRCKCNDARGVAEQETADPTYTYNVKTRSSRGCDRRSMHCSICTTEM